MIFNQEQLLILILSVIALIMVIVVIIEWRKAKTSQNSVLLLEKKAELKKIELVEKDLENKRRKEDLTELSEEDQDNLRQIRSNTSEVMAKVGLLSVEVNERVEQLEAKSELLKLQKLQKELEKKEAEIEKALKD
jgi:transposase